MFFVMLGDNPDMIYMTGRGGYTPFEHTTVVSYYLQYYCIYLLDYL